MKDESTSGAQLLVVLTSEIPFEFRLTADGIDDRACVFRWRSHVALGVEFLIPRPPDPDLHRRSMLREPAAEIDSGYSRVDRSIASMETIGLLSERKVT